MGRKIVILNSLPGTQVSGGNLYNHHIAAGCKRMGVPCELVFNFKSYDQLDVNDETVYLIDSVVIGDDIDLSFMSKINAVILLHMCPSLDESRPEFERKTIIEIEKKLFSEHPIISAGDNNLNYIKNVLGVKIMEGYSISPGVDKNWKRKEKFPIHPFNLCSIGSLSRSKGIIRTLNVLALCRDKEWKWNHFGSLSNTAFYQEVVSLGNELGIADRIRFHGPIGHERINQVMMDHDLLLHLSDNENNAMVIRESVASNLPFMSTPVGDFEIYQGANIGRITQSFEVVEIAKSVNEYLSDPEQYSRLCRSVVEHDIESWDAAAEWMIKVINQIFDPC